MKIVVQVKLLPSPEQASALGATLRACNRAADAVSVAAFEGQVFSRNDLQKLVYGAVKAEFGLSAQPAVRVVKKVVDAYATLRANIRAGHLGKPGSKRRARAQSKPVCFRESAAQPFDDRCLSWQYDARTVSIWTTAGRMKGLAFACSPGALKTLRLYRRGESDLVERDGAFFLIAVCEVPAEPVAEPTGWLGVDLGIVNIATVDGMKQMTGRGLNRHRKRQLDLRRKLQAKGTKSAKRLLKKRNRTERRHAANTNHVIAKTIVTEAQRTGKGIALEDLSGIRNRARLRKPQRVAIHSWAFHQLGSFLAYKAQRAGVALVHVDPAYTSQTCADCHHIDKKNRVSQALFVCRSCGVVAHADRNASRNIARKGEAAWRAGRESRVPATP
ncbi:RNA-guided endonuclease InsQ/TnpB family protein [Kitasatospora sp. NPDC058162]|uniref:RNA-guided endonuclease InsQ/TnpB family protein n=1 Tax=Kitasatospora sp. NPDC058162 TaxID=3346362 RepID=UPI0036DE0718